MSKGNKTEENTYGLSDTGAIGSRVLRNSGFRFGSELGCRFLGMLIAIWLARYLGDTVFGRYIFIVALIGFARIATNFGLDQVLIRSVAKDREHSQVYLGAGLVIRLFVFLLGIIPVILFVYVIDKTPDFKHGLIVGYLAIGFMIFNQTFDNVFNGHERFGIPSAFQLIAKMVQILLIAGAVYLKLGLVWMVGTFVGSEFIRAVFLWFISNRELGHPILDKDKMWNVARQSFPFLGITILAVIESRGDVVLLGLWCRDEVVGWYGAAINLSFSFLIISASVSDALFPVFSRLTDPSQRTLLDETHKRSMAFLLIVSLPISLSITILSGRIIRMLYPESFAPAAIILAISIWLITIKSIGACLVRIINAFHYEKMLLYITGMAALLKIILGVILIYLFRGIGAILSNVFVSIIMTILCIWISERKIGGLKYPLDRMLRSIPALVFLGVVTFSLKESPLVILIPSGVVCYTVLILLFRAITVKEIREMAKRLFRQ